MAATMCRANFKKSLSILRPLLTRSDTTDASSKFDRESYSHTIERYVNEVTLLGRLRNDPIRRGTEKHPVTLFSIATQVEYETPQGNLRRTDVHKVAVFKPHLRDTVLRLKKGQKCIVQGKLEYAEITDLYGQKKPHTNIIADDVILTGLEKNSALSSLWEE